VLGREIEGGAVPTVVVQVNLVAGKFAGIIEVKNKLRLLSGKYTRNMACVYFKLGHIAEGIQHAHAADGRQQKGEHISQTEVVIDIAQQHQQQQMFFVGHVNSLWEIVHITEPWL